MKLLVSVSNARDASAAVEGGADFVDAKDPRSGALGPVSLGVLREIHGVVAGRRPVTAALGDITDELTAERAAADFSLAGASVVKIGFGARHDARTIAAITRAA